MVHKSYSQKSCGFIFLKRLYSRHKALLASDRYSVGVCFCVYNKEDHISWYWQRKNLIQFRQLRQTMSLHVKPNKLQGGSSTRVHVCAILFPRLHKVVHTVMVLYCERSSCITTGKKKKINVILRSSVPASISVLIHVPLILSLPFWANSSQLLTESQIFACHELTPINKHALRTQAWKTRTHPKSCDKGNSNRDIIIWNHGNRNTAESKHSLCSAVWACDCITSVWTHHDHTERQWCVSYC